MAFLVDMNPALGVDLQDDEGTLVNGMATSTVEGGVYVVDPATGTALDSSGSYKYTGATAVSAEEIRTGMFVVSKGAYAAGATGQYVGFAQMQVRISAANGVIGPGDLLVPVVGQNYLVKASDSDLLTKRAVAKASKAVTSVAASLQWCYFAGIMPFFADAGQAGITDEMPTAPHILVNYMDYSGAFVNSGDATQVVMSTAHVPRPFMESGLLLNWDIIGLWFSNDAVAETYVFEMVINGVASGITFSFAPAGTVCAYPGILQFNSTSRVLNLDGSSGSTIMQTEARFRRYSEVDAALGDNTVVKRTTVHPAAGSINHTIDNDIQWRVRHTVGVNRYMAWNQVMAYMPAYRTGV